MDVHDSGFCPRCRTRLLGEVLVGRGTAHETSVPRITGLTCWCCGNWIEVVPQPMQLDREAMAPNRAQQQFGGGRKVGQVSSPAAKVAQRLFMEILRLREEGSGWETITRLVTQATKKKFCDRTLERYWLLECERRGVHPVYPKHGQLAGKKSAATRLARREGMA